MTHDLPVTVTILAMAVATYITRAGGLWLLSRMTLSPFMTSCLRHLPGTLLTAIVAPLLFKGDYAECTAAAVTVVMLACTGNLLLTLATGVSTVWLLRAIA